MFICFSSYIASAFVFSFNFAVLYDEDLWKLQILERHFGLRLGGCIYFMLASTCTVWSWVGYCHVCCRTQILLTLVLQLRYYNYSLYLPSIALYYFSLWCSITFHTRHWTWSVWSIYFAVSINYQSFRVCRSLFHICRPNACSCGSLHALLLNVWLTTLI